MNRETCYSLLGTRAINKATTMTASHHRPFTATTLEVQEKSSLKDILAEQIDHAHPSIWDHDRVGEGVFNSGSP
jgi:hypothetical protein